MSRPGTLQVALDSETQFALDALAAREGRSLSGMGAVLIREALAARGVTFEPPRRSARDAQSAA